MLRLGNSHGLRAPVMSMSSEAKQDQIRSQLLVRAMALSLAAYPVAANAVAASMDEITAAPSQELMSMEEAMVDETIEDTITRRWKEDVTLLIPGLVISAVALAPLFPRLLENEPDFFDTYDSRAVWDGTTSRSADAAKTGGGKFWDKKEQQQFGSRPAETIGTELKGAGSLRVNRDNTAKAAAKAAADAAKRQRRR